MALFRKYAVISYVQKILQNQEVIDLETKQLSDCFNPHITIC